MSRPTLEVLRDQIHQAALVLLEAGAKEVYLFGSAAAETMREGSDVDFAVAGLPPAVFFPAMGKVGDILATPFDLIDLDEDTPFVHYLKEEQELVRIA